MNRMLLIVEECLTGVRLWLRCPRHALMSTGLSLLVMVIATHVFVVRMNGQVRVGVVTASGTTARRLALALRDEGLAAVQYRTENAARSDIYRGALGAFIYVSQGATQQVHVVFAGRSPLLDRELAGLLMKTAARMAPAGSALPRVVLEDSRYNPETMLSYMAAAIIVIALLVLASINSGLLWLYEWDKRTVFSFAVTPAPWSALVIGRCLAHALIVTGTGVIMLVASRLFVAWTWPVHPVLWCGVLLSTVLFGIALYFAVAACTQRGMLYNDIAVLSMLFMSLLSGVTIPVETMPLWQRVPAYVMPTFYAVRAARAAMLGFEPFHATDVLLVLAWTVLCFVVGWVLLRRTRLV